MRPEVGFADLVRAIDRLAVTSYEEARAIAELISPGSTLPAPMPSAAPPAPPTPDAPNEREEAPHPEEKEGLESRRARPGRDDRVPPQRLTPSSADHGDAIFKQDLPPRSYQPADASVATPIALEGGAISEPLGILPLIEPKLARAIVSALVGRKEYDGPVDLPAAIATIARRKPLLRIPRHRRPTLRFGAQLLIDVGTGMSPYWLDAAEVERLVCKIVGADRVETARFRGPAAPVEAPAQDAAARFYEPVTALLNAQAPTTRSSFTT